MKPPRIYGAELMMNPAFENLKMNSMTPCWQVPVACSLNTGNMFKLPCSSFPANGMNLILTELLVMYRKTMRTTLLTGTPWTVKSVLMLIFDLVHYQFLCNYWEILVQSGVVVCQAIGYHTTWYIPFLPKTQWFVHCSVMHQAFWHFSWFRIYYWLANSKFRNQYG